MRKIAGFFSMKIKWILSGFTHHVSQQGPAIRWRNFSFFSAPGWLEQHQSFAKKHPLQSWAKKWHVQIEMRKKIGIVSTMKNPKTFIF